jgi:hypothetical protein
MIAVLIERDTAEDQVAGGDVPETRPLPFLTVPVGPPFKATISGEMP